MAQDLTDKQLPYSHGGEALTTNLVEISPPRGTMGVKVRATVDAWIQLGNGADAGAPGAAYRYPLTANAESCFNLAAGDTYQTPAPKIYLAAQSGTGTAYLVFQGAE